MLQSRDPPAEATKCKNTSFSFCFCPPDPSLLVHEPPAQRKRLVLQPRSKPATEEQDQESAASKSESDNDEEESPIEMTEDQAMTKIAENLKEFTVRNLDEGEDYTALPVVHHSRLVDKLTSSAVKQKETDAQLATDFFNRAVSKELVSSTTIEADATMSSPTNNHTSETEDEAEMTPETPISRFHCPLPFSTSREPAVQPKDKRETNTPHRTYVATALDQILEVVTQTRRENKLALQDLRETVAGVQEQLSSFQEQLDSLKKHIGGSIIPFICENLN